MYLETARLILRRMEESDYSDMREYIADPERCRMMGDWRPRNEAETREAFEWLMANEKRFYAMVLKSENKCVGYIIVSNFPDVENLPELAGLVGRSLAFYVARAYRRRGYAQEALEATIGYLFERRGVDYVNSGYFTFNEPSRRLHEKLGFTPIERTQVPLPEGGTAAGVETVIMSPAHRARFEGRVSEK